LRLVSLPEAISVVPAGAKRARPEPFVAFKAVAATAFMAFTAKAVKFVYLIQAVKSTYIIEVVMPALSVMATGFV